MATHGDSTIAMVQALIDDGVDHVALLMRHSAREFNRDIHDLLNPLTDEGRELSRRLGRALPKSHTLRGYASPAERCVETAQLAVDAHSEAGGEVTRVRPVDGLGVFYVLDQMKMFRVLRDAPDMGSFVSSWALGETPADALIPSAQAADLVMQVVATKLEQSVANLQIDLCVSHDLTLLLIGEELLDRRAKEHDVEFLDAVAVFKRGDRVYLQSHDGAATELTRA